MGQAKNDRRRAGSSEKKRPSRGMLKKKASHNSLGKHKSKRGSAAKFMTRSRALRSLQVSLKDFRRLCILKGVYPRDPPKKFQGADKTYYYTKDILYLQHEPLLAKFREMSALIKKVVRRAGRGETADAARLYDNRPVYRLDHLIRERYPTFADALRDLDDALCLVHLFACVPALKLLPPERVANCARLCREFQAIVAHTHALRKSFASIKGFYLQAELHGVPILWLVPGSARQEIPPDVDLKVLLTFLEFYEVLLQFVNYKLYAMRRLRYPPLSPPEAAEGVAHAGIQPLIQPAAGGGAPLLGGARAVHASNLRRSHSPYEAPSGEKMARFRLGLRAVEGAAMAAAEAAEGKQAAAAAAEEAAAEAAEAVAEGEADERADEQPTRLFSGLTVCLGRETPMATLELVLRSFGAAVVWEGCAGPLAPSSAEITHEIVDRPALRGAPVPGRIYAQPQWVLDCANAGQLLPAHAYAPGCRPPPHLSPFGDGSEGYVPPERAAHPAFGPAVPAGGARARAPVGAAAAAEEGEGEEGGVDVASSDDEPDEEEEDEEEEEEEEGAGEEVEDEAEDVFRRELEAERRGVAPAKPRKAEREAAAAQRRKSSGEQSAAEKKELSQMLMKKRDARLYKQMQFGIKRKQDAADKLAAKRQALAVEEEGSGGGGAAKRAGAKPKAGGGGDAPAKRQRVAPGDGAPVADRGGAKGGKPGKGKGKR